MNEIEGIKCVNIDADRSFRVPYVLNGSNRTYGPDFLLDDSWIVEIKPRDFWDDPCNQAKFAAAQPFFAQRGMAFKVIDIEISIPLIRYRYLNGDMTFPPTMENRFRKRVGLLTKDSDL